jgi:hypothetical protein
MQSLPLLIDEEFERSISAREDYGSGNLWSGGGTNERKPIILK